MGRDRAHLYLGDLKDPHWLWLASREQSNTRSQNRTSQWAGRPQGCARPGHLRFMEDCKPLPALAPCQGWPFVSRPHIKGHLGFIYSTLTTSEIKVAVELLTVSFINAFNVWLSTTGGFPWRACSVCGASAYLCVHGPYVSPCRRTRVA